MTTTPLLYIIYIPPTLLSYIINVPSEGRHQRPALRGDGPFEGLGPTPVRGPLGSWHRHGPLMAPLGPTGDGAFKSAP